MSTWEHSMRMEDTENNFSQPGAQSSTDSPPAYQLLEQYLPEWMCIPEWITYLEPECFSLHFEQQSEYIFCPKEKINLTTLLLKSCYRISKTSWVTEFSLTGAICHFGKLIPLFFKLSELLPSHLLWKTPQNVFSQMIWQLAYMQPLFNCGYFMVTWSCTIFFL